MIDIVNKEPLRDAVLRFLYDRQLRAPWSVSAIAMHVRNRQLVDFEFGEDDVAEACAFLEGLGFAVVQQGALGASCKFKVSAQGILYHERQRA